MRLGFRLATAVVATLATALGGASPSHGATKRPLRSCGTIATVTEGVKAREQVWTRGYDCSVARLVVRRSNEGSPVRGWVCSGSGEGAYCVRGTRSDLGSLFADPSRRPYRRYVQGDLTH